MTTASRATMPVSFYADPEVFARERKSIFSRSWLFLGHESQLAKSGAVLAATIAGFPVLAVRDEAGIIRAFHNVCRHRAGPLAADGESQCGARLTCRYHGWSYALDGRLASARDFGPAPDFDPRAFALYPLRCESWHGLIFVNADADAQPLGRFIAPFETKLGKVEWEGLEIVHRATHALRCNWKTYVENYLEGYHVPVVHPALNAAVAADEYDVQVASPGVVHRTTPVAGAAISGMWAWLWPGLAFNFYSGGVLLERMNPISHREMQIEYLLLAPKGTPQTEIDKSFAASAVTTREDIDICEAVQKNLDAGVYQVGRLSPKHEMAIAWFQSEIRKTLG
jgi:choline monooxygenase